MTYRIVANECISCGDCAPVCPTQSITEGMVVFQINAKTCTECAGDYELPQCVKVCPIDQCILSA